MTIILLGAQGQLGWELGATLAPLGHILHFNRRQADLADLEGLEKLVRKLKPRIIVNAAAYTNVDQAEINSQQAHLVNARAPELLARLAAELGFWLVHYSTDYVFDGKKTGSYTENDFPNPLNVYGQSKLDGDEAIMSSGCRHLIFRTSWVFSRDGHSFPRTILDKAKHESTLSIVADQFGSPTSVELLAGATALALRTVLSSQNNDLSGLYNLVSSGSVSWHEYAVYLATKASELGWELLAKPQTIAACDSPMGGARTIRPSNSRLDTSKLTQILGLTLPPWQYYIDRVLWAWTKMENSTPNFTTKDQVIPKYHH